MILLKTSSSAENVGKNWAMALVSPAFLSGNRLCTCSIRVHCKGNEPLTGYPSLVAMPKLCFLFASDWAGYRTLSLSTELDVRDYTLRRFTRTPRMSLGKTRNDSVGFGACGRTFGWVFNKRTDALPGWVRLSLNTIA